MRTASITIRPQTFEWRSVGGANTTSPSFEPWIGTTQLTSAINSFPRILADAVTYGTLTYNCSASPATGTVHTVTLQYAPPGSTTFADTGLTLTIPSGSATGTVISVSGALSCAKGGMLALKTVQSVAAANAGWVHGFTLSVL